MLKRKKNRNVTRLRNLVTLSPSLPVGSGEPFACCHSERVSRSPEPFTPRHSEGVLRSPCHSERSEESNPAQGKLREESHRSEQAPRLKNLAQGKLRDRRIPLRAGSAKAFTGNSKGISLIEVVIALAILGIVAVAFLGGLSTAFKADIIADERSVAQSLAQSQMEYVKSEGLYSTTAWSYTVTTSTRNSSNPPGSPPDDGWWDPANNKPPLLSSDYAGYCAEVKAEDFDADGDGNIEVPGDDEGIRKITVTVYHSEVVDEDEKVFTLEDYKVNR